MRIFMNKSVNQPIWFLLKIGLRFYDVEREYLCENNDMKDTLKREVKLSPIRLESSLVCMRKQWETNENPKSWSHPEIKRSIMG